MPLRMYHMAVLCAWWAVSDNPNVTRYTDHNIAVDGGIVFG